MSGTPVLFFVYNRLGTTARVFERIAAARPDTLLVVADGPRASSADDLTRCEAVRQLVTHPNWPCDVRLNVATENLGFNKRISSGLQWGFSQFEELIILEDDCVPDPSFFRFCAEMLSHFRSRERVKMISGCNFQFGRTRGNGSYYASHGVGTWGWASWRRAFDDFDPEMRAWVDSRDTAMLEEIWPDPVIVEYWKARFDEASRGDVDAWDYQWAFAMWRRHGLQIAPNVNLIEYIGCLPDAVHTNDSRAPFCNVPRRPISWPLRHPQSFDRDLTADLFEFYRVFLSLEDDEAERRSRAFLR